MKLLAVPNVSEGRDLGTLGLLSERLASSSAELLETHSDADHSRTVFTVLAEPPLLIKSMLSLCQAAVEEIDMANYSGHHPCIGAVDVMPIVYWRSDQQQAAAETAGEVARQLASGFGLPIFLYGQLASSSERRARSYFRRGGVEELRRRMESGELKSDIGPTTPHPTAVATLLTARQPLVAFNIELETQNVELAKQIAAGIRETGGGLPGVSAIGLFLNEHGCAQVSTNVEDLSKVLLKDVVEVVSERSGDTEIRCAEIVGLVSEQALVDFPDQVTIRDFNPDLQILERRVG